MSSMRKLKIFEPFKLLVGWSLTWGKTFGLASWPMTSQLVLSIMSTKRELSRVQVCYLNCFVYSWCQYNLQRVFCLRLFRCSDKFELSNKSKTGNLIWEQETKKQANKSRTTVLSFEKANFVVSVFGRERKRKEKKKKLVVFHSL